jgi:hypothetical protein
MMGEVVQGGWVTLAAPEIEVRCLSFAKRSSASQVIDLSALSGHNRDS